MTYLQTLCKGDHKLKQLYQMQNVLFECNLIHIDPRTPQKFELGAKN